VHHIGGRDGKVGEFPVFDASEIAKIQRLKQVGMLVASLKRRKRVGDEYALNLGNVLGQLGYPIPPID
jgi:hypothetical protein